MSQTSPLSDPAAAPAKPFKRLLLTGAAGNLGQLLRQRLKPWTEVLRLADLTQMGEAQVGEELVTCDLADKAAVYAMLEGVDAVLHFGGRSLEAPFEQLMHVNIQGTYNLYEAVHKRGIRRVVYASSSHAVGFYPTTERIDADSPVRPDGLYGLTKCFGEALSRYYFDRFGVETVCLRIGSCFPEPRNARMLATYLSYDDLTELVRCALMTPRVGHTIVYGVSDNRIDWWDNSRAGHLGFVARDSADGFAGRFAFDGNWPAADDAGNFQGGPFILAGPQYDAATPAGERK